MAISVDCFRIVDRKDVFHVRCFQMSTTVYSVMFFASPTIRQPEVRVPWGGTLGHYRISMVNLICIW